MTAEPLTFGGTAHHRYRDSTEKWPLSGYYQPQFNRSWRPERVQKNSCNWIVELGELRALGAKITANWIALAGDCPRSLNNTLLQL